MIYLILLLHWIGDFILQFRWLANNKSHNRTALYLHGLIYGLTLTAGLWYFMYGNVPTAEFILFIALNIVLHVATDAITSKITSYCYKKEWMHMFFAVVGFDQMLHIITLMLTMHTFFRIDNKDWLFI